MSRVLYSGGSRPSDKEGEGGGLKKILSALRASISSKNSKGEVGRTPPLDPLLLKLISLSQTGGISEYLCFYCCGYSSISPFLIVHHFSGSLPISFLFLRPSDEFQCEVV